MERLKHLNKALPDMIVSQAVLLVTGEIIILCAGINVFAIGTGYAAGIIYSVVALIHMAVVMDRAMYYEEKGAVARTVGGYFVRLLILIVIEAVLYLTGGITAMFASMAALFTVKVSAYTQPFTHNLIKKFKRKGGKESGQSNDECSGA